MHVITRCLTRRAHSNSCTICSAWRTHDLARPHHNTLCFSSSADQQPYHGQPAFKGIDAQTLDLTNPASWYPYTRSMKRRLIAHLGPTNSGKTYQALQAMKGASSGAYCGPLRLLAWEVAELMNREGLPCDLITESPPMKVRMCAGQERRLVEESKHSASTVEMANLSDRIKVAVIDEVQMLGDPLRGSSYTRAILGLPAEELHLCGDPAALPLLKKLAEEAGDTFEVKSYNRLAALRVANRTLPDISQAQRGDCLVAFSRKDVHIMKQKVETRGQHSCCVVYGALPPQSRAHQAILFNTTRTGYNVLAATDAVGMGLNLNIRRIVFSSLEKFDGREMRLLTPAEVKQIAGRAGRFGSKYSEGVVTCLDPADLPYLREAMLTENPVTQRASLIPSFEQIAMLAQHSNFTLAEALETYGSRAVLSEHYFLGDYENMLGLAIMLEPLPLTLNDSYIFSMSPTDSKEPRSTAALYNFARAYCSGTHVSGGMVGQLPQEIPSTASELKSLEIAHGILDLYIWLSYRLEDSFPDRKQVEHLRVQCSVMIAKGLERISRQKPRGVKNLEVLQQSAMPSSVIELKARPALA